MTKQERIDKIFNECINKQLEKYNITINDVYKGGLKEFHYKPKWLSKIPFCKRYCKKIPWYVYYTMTEQEFLDWQDFCINLIRKELKHSKIRATQEFNYLVVSFGLRII